MGGKTEVVNSSSTQTRTLSPQEIEFNNKQLAILDRQLAAIEKSNEFQQGVFEAVKPVLDDYSKVLEAQVSDLNDPVTKQIQQRAKDLQLQQIEFAGETLPIQRELLQEQLDTIKRGGAATPEQAALIDEYTKASLESGTTDINRFLDDTLQRIRGEMAPARGLRPSDTPIADVADRAAAEAVRQRGQLQSNLQQANIGAKINLPLAISQLTGAQSQAQQGINLATQQFADTLSQSAAANRLQVSNLLGGAIGSGGAGGINLSRISPSGFFQSGTVTTSGTSTRDTNDPFGGLGMILSGGGAALRGLGAVGLFSSRTLKNRLGEAGDVVAAIKELPVERWRYKGDNSEHIGPYAEDFRSLFGYGDGMTIPVVDALGILFAAVKELAKRQEAAHG